MYMVFYPFIIDKKNIIKVLDSFMYQNHFCIVMECFDMNLRDNLPKNIRYPVPITTLQSYAQSLLKTLYFLKKRQLIHADSNFRKHDNSKAR